jgi:hypothetical protein
MLPSRNRSGDEQRGAGRRAARGGESCAGRRRGGGDPQHRGQSRRVVGVGSRGGHERSRPGTSGPRPDRWPSRRRRQTRTSRWCRPSTGALRSRHCAPSTCWSNRSVTSSWCVPGHAARARAPPRRQGAAGPDDPAAPSQSQASAQRMPGAGPESSASRIRRHSPEEIYVQVSRHARHGRLTFPG